MNNAVEVRDLALQRRAFRLGPLSFGVAAGGRLAIVGPSGSGKSTLLRCIAGLEQPSGGTIVIGGEVVHGGKHPVAPDRRGVGLVFQDGALWSHMTALQHLKFAAPRSNDVDLRGLLARANIDHLADRKPAAMSGGEAQRLGLVRALAASPRVLLLDEPLRSVDVHQRDGLVMLLRTIADERSLTTVLVTHDRDEALALATDLVVLHEGRIVEAGPAAKLLQAPTMAFTAAFLAGAACLPTTLTPSGSAATPFGDFARPSPNGELRLVLLPGDVTATAVNGAPSAATAARGRVLAAWPSANGTQLRVTLGDQILPAHTSNELAIGQEVQLSLLRPPRLLPWEPNGDRP